MFVQDSTKTFGSESGPYACYPNPSVTSQIHWCEQPQRTNAQANDTARIFWDFVAVAIKPVSLRLCHAMMML
jgi:hypothetical protein